MKKYFDKTGICVPTILLPNSNISKKTWAVIACDQFTSEPEYWEEVSSIVGNNPSTYHIIFPEAYLEKVNKQEKIKTINNQMQQYIDKNVLENSVDGFIFVNRTFPNGSKRKGIMVSIDLDQYDFSEGSKAMVRATEKTVVERIPPRVEIRENSPLELPHVLVLIDDPDETVIEPLSEQTMYLRCVYDFDLMINGGHIEGYAIEDPETIEHLMSTLEKLTTKDGLLYAVGDGNHSLATAKQCWDNLKTTISEKDFKTHPARFALVELNNLHDPDLLFEPIHRIVSNVDVDDLLSFIQGDGKSVEIINNGIKSKIQLSNISGELTLGVLQQLLDKYRETHPEMTMDYIHGEKSLEKLSKSISSIGFLLKSIQKNNLFNVISSDGCLPRKTFSMGEANEKRYYLEARKIK